MNDTPAVRLGWVIRVTVYVMLLLSAAVTFLFNDRLWQAVRSEALPAWVALAPVAAFTAFVVVYAIDRLLLLRRRHFPPGRAFFQVGLAVLFLTLLWPQQAAEFKRAQHDPGAVELSPELLAHREATVRAAGCELAGLKAQVDLREQVARLAKDDGAPLVRAACELALERLNAHAGMGVP